MTFLFPSFRRCLQLFQCPAELVGTTGGLFSASYAVEFADHVVDFLSCHQTTDPLQVAVAATYKEHLLDHIIIIGRHINQP